MSDATYAPPPPLANLRDVGGHRVWGGGQIRTGLVYRSADLSATDEPGLARLADLGVRTVYDLRTSFEREAHPDRLPAGARLVTADVLADGSTTTSPSELMALLRDPPRASELLADGGSARIFTAKYREFVALGSARRAYGLLFRDLAVAGNLPALFHCTTGKDRTGWATAALLLLLGVPQDDVMADYLESNAHLLAAFDAAFEAFRRAGGDPEILHPMIGVRPSYLEAALETMRAGYGTIEAYFADGLGVDEATQGVLRHTLVATT